MQNETPLDEMYRSFALGNLEREAFESALFAFVKRNPHRYRLRFPNEDERDDFLGELYPKIRRSVDAYRDRGASFDAYFYSVVHWAAVDFRCSNAERAAVERAYWAERAVETRDPEPGYGTDAVIPRDGAGAAGLRNPRQVLALTLKCCMFVSDDFCERIAPALNIEPRELKDKVERLRKGIAVRAERRREIETRAATLYYRCVVLEAKLRRTGPGDSMRSELERSLRHTRRCLGSLRSRAAAISLEATNREIAASLGIPKGTVDAGLHFLKKRMEQAGTGPLSAPRGDRI